MEVEKERCLEVTPMLSSGGMEVQPIKEFELEVGCTFFLINSNIKLFQGSKQNVHYSQSFLDIGCSKVGLPCNSMIRRLQNRFIVNDTTLSAARASLKKGERGRFKVINK